MKIGAKPELAKSSYFFTIPLDETIKAKILIDTEHILSGEFCKYFAKKKELIWEYTGDAKDPSVSLNVKPQFSILIPAIVRIGDDKVYKIIRGPASIHKMLFDVAKKNGTLLGSIVEFKSIEKNKFREYSVKLVGKGNVDEEYKDQDLLIKDIENKIKVGSVEEIQEWLNENLGVTKGIVEEDF